MSDKYDEQIEYLVKNPQEISSHWVSGRGLFQLTCLGGGCLTMIRKGRALAPTPELSVAIRADERIPKDASELSARFYGATPAERRELLQPFAEWRRKIDQEIRGTVNV